MQVGDGAVMTVFVVIRTGFQSDFVAVKARFHFPHFFRFDVQGLGDVLDFAALQAVMARLHAA